MKTVVQPSVNKSERITKRHQVFGGHMFSVKLKKNDQLVITDMEGLQPCTILALEKKQLVSVEKLKLRPNKHLSDALNFEQLNKQFQTFLKGHSIQLNDPSLVSSYSCFLGKNLAGKKLALEAEAPVICVILAWGADMQIDKQTPPTPLYIEHTSAHMQTLSEALPKQLGEVKTEVHIDDSTAKTYLVKAGDYIEIIDIEGHQCSDFQAFAISDLQAGREWGIEPTVTRSLMGSSYPVPGTQCKYYNQNAEPLVEVIHDKVVRHDTFSVACTAKYYDDKGYLGHVSCTENFNAVLKNYGVSGRKSWVAVNLFFNTNIEDSDALFSDVSWSRPGDYVLFRAMTDLLCVSSACPDDTSSTNNWNPTDIHVRIYDKTHQFTPGIAFRPTPETIAIMTKETSFHPQTSKLTRNFIEAGGYWLAKEYTQYGAIKEYWACRQGVAMMDLSSLRKFEILGEDAETLLQLALTRDVRKLSVGQIVYTGLCYENGGMIDDGTLFRMDENNFRWICGSEISGLWLRELAQEKGLNVWVKSATDQLHNIAVQGPKSRDLLKKIYWNPARQANMDELKWFRFSIGRIKNEQGIPVIVSRTGYTGELGYEVFCHPKDASALWETVWDAGIEFDITPMGLDALDMLRIESGLIFAGHEFCDQIDPFEAGIGFSVPLKTKEEDFIGKTALIRKKENPERHLVGLEIDSNEIVNHGEGVFVGRQQVGVITSATRSPILKKNIALCRMSIRYTEIGTAVEIGKLDGHQKRISAGVVTFPFYDPEKIRVRM